MSILIEKIRIKNFRSLQNIEVALKPITILVGANNSGKTTFLRAINSVLGIAKNQINKDDLFVDRNGTNIEQEIVIDTKIVSVDNTGSRIQNFDSKWIGGIDVLLDSSDFEYIAFRTIYKFGVEDHPSIENYLFTNWEKEQLQKDVFMNMPQIRNNIKMFFIDAQRDILEDSKLRTSFFGKLVSQLDYGDNLEELKKQIANLNTYAIDKSEVLKHLKTELSNLNKTTQTKGEGVSLDPFPKKISDLHKGMKVYFQDNGSDTFSMDNHGMGTRSWASIITAGAFTSWELKQIEKKAVDGITTNLLFPIFGLEEPEAHLHPNAQRTLYKQLKDFKGQKIISTHSPYIAGQAELDELRHFFKEGDASTINIFPFDKEDRNRIKELQDKVELEGKTEEAYKKYNPDIKALSEVADTKLTNADKRILHREIMLSRGELLFAKALVLFEGITEELALPVFYDKHFKRNHFEDGLTYVEVGGKKNYSPFLKLAKYLKIPVYILSDGDNNTETEVINQVKKVFGNSTTVPLFVLPNNTDFEKYLVENDFKAEIIKAIDIIEEKQNYLDYYISKLHGKEGKKKVIRDYTGEVGVLQALLDCMYENKTEFAKEIAEQIVQSDKPIPPKIRELFEILSESLNITPDAHE